MTTANSGSRDAPAAGSSTTIPTFALGRRAWCFGWNHLQLFESARRGDKTLETRMNVQPYSSVQVGDVILHRLAASVGQQKPPFWTLVVGISYSSDFPSACEGARGELIMPNQHVVRVRLWFSPSSGQCIPSVESELSCRFYFLLLELGAAAPTRVRAVRVTDTDKWGRPIVCVVGRIESLSLSEALSARSDPRSRGAAFQTTMHDPPVFGCQALRAGRVS